MKKIILYTLVALAFSQQSVASVAASQYWLRSNKLNMIHSLNNALEIAAKKPTNNKTNAFFQIRFEGPTIRIVAGTVSGGNTLFADMLEVSRPTANSVSLIERDYYGRKKDLVRVDVTKQPDGRFLIRYLDRDGNGFEGVITYSEEDDRHLNPTCC